MTRNRKYLIGGLSLAAIAAGGVAASAHHGGMGWHGHGGPMGHGLMGMVCRGDAAEAADHMLVRLQYQVKPTDAQKPAFEELKAAAHAAALKAKAGCPAEPAVTADGARPAPKPPTERLALLEARLAAELDAIHTVRPAADKFYATLSDEQKKLIAEPAHRAEAFGGGEREHGWHRHGDGQHDRRADGPDGADGAPKGPDKP